MKHLLLAGWLAVFSGDAITTDIGLQQGAVERMWPTQSRPISAAITTDQALIGYWAYKKWHVTHPTLMKVMYIVGVSTHGTATIYNLYQLK